MSANRSPERLSELFAHLLKRIERLEGKQEELRRTIIPPGILYPKRSELDALETRIARLEKPSEPGKA